MMDYINNEKPSQCLALVRPSFSINDVNDKITCFNIHSLLKIFFFLIFFLNVYLFILGTEREHERGRGRERGRHRIGNRLQALSHQPKILTRGSNSRTTRS